MARLTRDEEGGDQTLPFLPDAPETTIIRDRLNIREPAIDETLMAYLAVMFPDRLPDHIPDNADVAYRVGQQNVIRHLRALHNRQTKEQTD